VDKHTFGANYFVPRVNEADASSKSIHRRETLRITLVTFVKKSTIALTKN